MEKLYSGVKVIKDFKQMDEFYKNKRVPIEAVNLSELYPNMFLILKSGKNTAIGIVKKKYIRLVQYNQKIQNIESRNKEQDMSIELLKDKSIECVTLLGPAGSGKTLLALAYAVDQLKNGEVGKIILCKNFTPVGREIGFLKGSFEEKTAPWLGNFYDNFEVLGISEYELERMNSYEYQKENPGKIELTPITFVQGRSISNAVIIVDEVQNLSKDVIKQILTRPAENCKIILLGDPKQIFEKNVENSGNDGNNALTEVVNSGKDACFIGHLTMLKSERSRLAEWYSKKL